MADLWNYRSDLTRFDHDIAGYDVQATDGSIGRVDEANRETDSAHLVVDTGFWIFGRRRVIPAGVATNIDHDNRTVYLDITKAQVKAAPDWHEGWSIDTTTRQPYEEFYGPFIR